MKISFTYPILTYTTSGGVTCGNLYIQTQLCNGAPRATQAYTVEKWNGSSWATFATGTTDAGGLATVTGATYGGANDQYRLKCTDATGLLTGSPVTLTSTYCAATLTMRMATSALFPCAPPNDSETLLTASPGTYSITGCSSASATITVNVDGTGCNWYGTGTLSAVAAIGLCWDFSGSASPCSLPATGTPSWSSYWTGPLTNASVKISCGASGYLLYQISVDNGYPPTDARYIRMGAYGSLAQITCSPLSFGPQSSTHILGLNNPGALVGGCSSPAIWTTFYLAPGGSFADGCGCWDYVIYNTPTAGWSDFFESVSLTHC